MEKFARHEKSIDPIVGRLKKEAAIACRTSVLPAYQTVSLPEVSPKNE